MTRPLMSVGIPTFNGAEYLPSAIESVIREIPNGLEDSFEIVISDNASTDNTRQVAQSYQDRFPKLVRYRCNEQNIGYDRNVDAVVKNSAGEYVKLLGDDDELLPGSLDTLHRNISSNRHLVAIVHSVRFLDISTGEIGESDHRIGTTRRYACGDEFFRESLWATAALSSLVVQRDAWVRCNLEKYFGTNWIHVGGLIEMLRGKQNSLGIEEQLTLVRLKNARWAQNFGDRMKVTFDHLDVMSNLLSGGYGKQTFAAFVRSRFDDNLNNIMQFRSAAFLQNMRPLIRMTKYFWRFPRFWVKDAPLLMIGSSYLRFGQFGKRMLNALSMRK